MNTFCRERVEEHSQCRDEGLAFAGLHFGNLTFMEGDTPHQLDVIVPLTKSAFRCLANTRERFGKQFVKTGAAVETFAQGRHRTAEIIVTDFGNLVFKAIDCGDLSGELLRRSIGPRPEEVFRQ